MIVSFVFILCIPSIELSICGMKGWGDCGQLYDVITDTRHQGRGPARTANILL